MTGFSPPCGACRRSVVRGLVLAALVAVCLGLALSGPAVAADNGGQNDTESDGTVAPAQSDGGPDLQLTSIDYPDTIEPDGDLEITYSLENVGDEEGTESFIDLLVEGSLVDRVSNVTLGPGESGSATFTYTSVEETFEPGDTIDFTVELVDFGDSMSGTTTIGSVDQSGTLDLREPVQTDSVSVAVEITSLNVTEEPGWLEVENTDNAASPALRTVAAGDFVTVPVEDIGGVALNDTIEVRLAADSDMQELLDTASTTVTAGENAPVANFQWTPGVPEVGQPVSFDASSSLGSGSDIVEYRWDFNNDGEFDITTGAQTTEFVFLEGGVTEVTLVVENAVGLTSEETTSITVQTVDPPESALSGLDVAGQGASATVSPDEAGDVSVTVTNEGEAAGSFDVTLTVGGVVTETQTTGELAAGDEELVTFGAVTGDLDPGAYDVTVWTDDDEVTGELTVETPPEPDPEFAVDIVETNSPRAGDNLTVTVDIENVGGGEATGEVTLETDSLGSDTASVTLASGESTNETLTLATAEGDAGDHEVTVTSGSDASATTVTVRGADDGSLFSPTLLFVLVLVLLLGAGAYYYYIHDQPDSRDGMEPL